MVRLRRTPLNLFFYSLVVVTCPSLLYHKFTIKAAITTFTCSHIKSQASFLFFFLGKFRLVDHMLLSHEIRAVLLYKILVPKHVAISRNGRGCIATTFIWPLPSGLGEEWKTSVKHIRRRADCLSVHLHNKNHIKDYNKIL